MKKEKIRNLIREYLELRNRIESLQEELRGLQKEPGGIRNSFGKNSGLAAPSDKEGSLLKEIIGLRRRMERVEGSLISYRSRDFIRSVVSCVLDLRPEYGKDEHYHNLLTSLVSIVIHFEEYAKERKSNALRELLHLRNEKVEQDHFTGQTKSNRGSRKALGVLIDGLKYWHVKRQAPGKGKIYRDEASAVCQRG